MSLTAVFPLLSASISFVVGMFYLLAYSRKHNDKLSLYFALWCLAATAYAVSSSGLYNSEDPLISQSWQTAQFYSIVVGVPFQILFARAYLGLHDRWPTILLISVYPIMMVLSMLRPDMMFTANPFVRTISVGPDSLLDFARGFQVTYVEMETGPLWSYLAILNLPVYIYYFAGTLWAIRTGLRTRGYYHLLVVGIFFLAVINDIFVGENIYTFIYILEYSFMAYILLMAYSLLAEIIHHAELKEELQALKEGLETKVDERTEELRAANSALMENEKNLIRTLAQLKETQTQLIQSERVAAVGNMVSGIAHRMNTPLGIAITASTFLYDNTTDMLKKFQSREPSSTGEIPLEWESFLESNVESCRLVHSSLETTAELVRRFRNVAIDEYKSQKHEINLRETIEASAMLLEDDIKNSQVFFALRCPDKLIVSMPRNAVFQIISNLIQNSLKHGFADAKFPDDGPEKKIEVEVSQIDHSIKIDFTDNGVGIPANVRNRVFDPFFTTSQNEGSTGLGLMIVYRTVADLLGGEVTLESQEFKYTRISIVFPEDKSPD